MRGCCAFALLITCAPFADESFADQVSATETVLKVPTYLVEADDKNPPLWDFKVYPYPMQTAVTRQRETVAHRAVVLENKYVRVIIFPDLGGRVYAAHDKTNNDFDFIYHNHVVKPGLVALRGAWISGGIEWNFPTLGHTVNTFSPVLYRVQRSGDGSVTCVVGTTEWVRRMKWSVAITVFPNRSDFRTRVRLFNRTLTHNNGYFWSNAAAHAWDDTRTVFPPTDYTFAGRRDRPQKWPMFEGKDRSWYRNTPYPYDYFCGVPGDFSGCYNHRRDSGTVHCGAAGESPGKKFWTWGTAPSGALWEKLLTDADGQYIEIQGGRLLTQGDTWIFEPHLLESWDETWYAVKKMGGFVKANPQAAVNFDVQGDHVRVACNTTRPYRNAQIVLMAAGKEVWHETLNIDPEHPWSRPIPLPVGGDSYGIALRDSTGREVIAYDTARKPIPPPELQPTLSVQDAKSAEALYFRGYYALKHWNPEGAVALFEQALSQDPGLTPALRALAMVRYKSGRFADALSLCAQALARNEDDYTARYYRVLSKIKLGVDERVEEDLHLLGRRAAYRHVAPFLLATLAVRKGELQEATELLQTVARCNPDDLKARVLLAAVLRHRSHDDEAERLAQGVLAEDPLNCLALIEQSLRGTSDVQRTVLRDDPQYYLEAACDYAEMNLFDDAIATLHLAEKRDRAARYPLVSYYLGAYYAKTGSVGSAGQYFAKAAQGEPDYVFPFRTETEPVLRAAARHDPGDWKAHYYLGNLLTARLRWREGQRHYLAAAATAPGYATLHRNLGEVYWHKAGNREKAVAAYKKAIACDPTDVTLYVALDRLHAEMKQHDARAKLFARAPAAVRSASPVLLRESQFHVDIGQYDAALAILRDHTFLPWEGWTGARDVYAGALRHRAVAAMQDKEYMRAIKDLRAAMEYPENLGTGRPDRPNYLVEHFHLAQCCQGLGKHDEARNYFTQVADESRCAGTQQTRMKARALDQLGRADEARALLKKAGLTSGLP